MLEQFKADVGIGTKDGDRPANSLWNATITAQRTLYAQNLASWADGARLVGELIGAVDANSANLLTRANPPARSLAPTSGGTVPSDGSLDYEGIARAVGFSNLNNFKTYWPMISAELKKQGALTRNVTIAMLATIRPETGSFAPVDEVGDSRRYRGRGFVQLTGEGNYRNFGKLIGVDLVAHPELANEPHNAARIAALFFVKNGCATQANAGNWLGVRQILNGGHLGATHLNGMKEYNAAIAALTSNPNFIKG